MLKISKHITKRSTRRKFRCAFWVAAPL